MQKATASAGANRSVMEVFDELLGVLHLVAGGASPSRERAVSYLNCRSQLLASERGNMLPGFLYQCGTVDRFREFIFLYDPDVALRREFIDRMIGRARALGVPEPDDQPAAAPDAPAPRDAAGTSKITATTTWDF